MAHSVFHAEVPEGNDRDTADGDRNATSEPMTEAQTAPARSALDDALERLRLDGAIFFRAEFTEGWSYESPEAGPEGV